MGKFGSAVEKRLLRNMVKASQDFHLIEANARIMVCMSGGKDSYAMLHLMQIIQRRSQPVATFHLIVKDFPYGNLAVLRYCIVSIIVIGGFSLDSVNNTLLLR